MAYHYFGLVYKTKATLALLHVSLIAAGAHAAVWLGASQATTRWVQAGIEMHAGDPRPYLYIETKAPGRGYALDEWPAPPHQVRVRLLEHAGRWRVQIGGHSSRWVWVPHAMRLATLELLGTFRDRGTARIDGRLVSGRG